MRNLKEYSPTIIRITISLVFLWFGINQMFNHSYFIGYLPGWVGALPFEASTFLIINGVVETILGTLLLIGLFTRLTALILAVHLFGITLSLGYNDIAVRDLGLTLVTFAIFLYGPDRFTLDEKRKSKKA